MATAHHCPFCGQHSQTTEGNAQASHQDVEFSGKRLRLDTSFTFCLNRACKGYTLLATLNRVEDRSNGTIGFVPEHAWRLIPSSAARPLPNYIPTAIVADYTEACLIASLSPKASATLSRRCLQGMIRDFWGANEKTLFAEITAIKFRMDPETWAAIDALRRVGNIGAHMEADINVIIDVDPDEAQQLIGLLEMLIDEWYVARETRKNRIAGVIAIGASKAEAKKAEASA
jgi:hypothetical protein